MKCHIACMLHVVCILSILTRTQWHLRHGCHPARKKGVLALSTPSPRSSVLTVLNIVINFNSDNSNARLLGNSLAVVPIISVRERLLSDLQSFNSGFQ